MSGLPVRLGEAIRSWRRRRLPPRGQRSAEVFRAFEGILGEPPRARPVSFRRGVLLVEVESAAHFHELHNFARRSAVDRLNRTLGAPLVTGISFRLASPRPPAGGGSPS